VEAFGLVCMYSITAFDDYRTRSIRVMEIIVFAIIGIIMNIVAPRYTVLSVAGGVGVGVVMLAFSILSKEKIGKGDALIVMVSGLYLGFMNTLVLVWFSSILAAIFGLITLRKYDNYREAELPFVPFILIGYMILFTIKSFGGILG